MIGGSMKRKKTFGVSVEGGCSDVRNRRNPMMIPTTMRRHDSGKMWCSFGVMWNPANIKRVNSFVFPQETPFRTLGQKRPRLKVFQFIFYP